MTEQEARQRVIRAMCPEKVCRVCGEPSRRIVATQPEIDDQRALADEIAERRSQAGVSRADMVPWFPHYKNGESVMAQVSNWERAKNVPSPSDWQILKTRLGLSDTFDVLVNSDRRWTESEIEYEYVNNDLAGLTQDASGRLYRRLTSRQNRIAPDAFSDCGHDDWRPGVVLDPFEGLL